MSRRFLLPALLVLTGVLVALSGYAVSTLTRPAPSAVVVAVPTAPGRPTAPVTVIFQAAPPAAYAPKRDASGYLTALRAAGVPLSDGGAAEVAIARGVCDQLAAGTPRGKLTSDLNAMYAPLFGVDGYYFAVAVVDAAQASYC